MKKSVGLWELIGFAVTALGGTLLHFLYEWLGDAVWTAPFSAVNESTWEHMKLLFWPMLLFAFFQRFFFRERRDFWCVKLKGIFMGLMLIPVIFYTYNGAIGRSPDWLNVAIFFISAALAHICEARALYSENSVCKNSRLALSALLVLGALFVIFTFQAPELAIFKDPLSKTYGI